MPGGPSPARDPRLAWFAPDTDGRDALVPSGLLALAADELTGPGRRCPDATADELTGLLRGFAALESWAAAGKLGVVAELIRRDDQPRKPCGYHGDLPDDWSASLRHDLALALSCSVQSAQTTAWLAWELQARLPGIGILLHAGTLTPGKARAVAETFQYLTDADAARAEAMILGQLADKTYPQVLRLAEQASLTVDPELAQRQREETHKRNARVTFFREQSGTAGLSGRDLLPDEALAAMAGVNARAQQYEDAGAFGDLPMDALRVYAFTDLLKGTPAEERIACAEAQDEDAEIAEALAWANARAARNAAQAQPGHTADPESGRAPVSTGGPDDHADTLPGQDQPAATRDDDHGNDADARARRDAPRDDVDDDAGSPGRMGSPRDRGDDDHPGANGDDGANDRESGGNGGGDSAGPQDGPGNCGDACDDCTDCGPVNGGDAQGHPGGHDDGDNRDDSGSGGEPGDDGPGPGDSGSGGPGGNLGPGASPAGRAFQPRLPDLIVPLLTLLGLAERPGEIQGFGLLDPALARDMTATAIMSPHTEICVTVTSPEGYAIAHGCARPERSARSSQKASTPQASPSGLPARLNLTISATALNCLPGITSGAGSWAFVPRPSTGPPGGADPPDSHGTWVLTLPDGRRFTVRLDVVPTLECDHRYETTGYHPSARLRHLVQVRDGTCTFPSCNRHARESDFEHAIPFEKGGRTCACNAGARSRACHRVKQTKGWKVVAQQRPGWHEWHTPSGRVYVQEPKRYPA
jgi:hypothetical protein